MKLTEVYKVLKFEQSEWLKKYINFNKNKRKNAVNSFQKSFFKLVINSIHGKTMENLKKRMNVKLVNNAKDCKKNIYITQVLFHKKSLVKNLLLFMRLNQF